jgi:hypothetical protein
LFGLEGHEKIREYQESIVGIKGKANRRKTPRGKEAFNSHGLIIKQRLVDADATPISLSPHLISSLLPKIGFDSSIPRSHPPVRIARNPLQSLIVFGWSSSLRVSLLFNLDTICNCSGSPFEIINAISFYCIYFMSLKIDVNFKITIDRSIEF